MIGRMLQFLYHGSYDVLNLATDLTRLLDTSSPSTILVDTTILAQDFDFEIHAAMLAIGDRFDIPSLKSTSQALFVAELRSQHFRVADLLGAIDLVFTTTPEDDIGLRKWVVYCAQQIEGELVCYDDFKAVLKRQPDFALDLATKYAKANYVWCMQCLNTIQLVECRCGFSGMCGDPTCAKGALKRLMCTRCETSGVLQREIPQLEGDVDVELGVLRRAYKPDARIKKSSKKRRRLG
jgi:hypothetical protein